MLKLGASALGYNGYLLKVGGSSGDIFPESYMYKDSYKSRFEAQDLDSGRSANGVLKRKVLDHVPAVVSFTLKPMHESDFNAAMNLIRKHYTTRSVSSGVYPERKLVLYHYNPEYGKYFSGTFYLVTPDPTVMQTYKKPKDLRYDAMALEFIEY